MPILRVCVCWIVCLTNQKPFASVRFTDVQPPNPDCIVCSEKPSVLLKVDTGKVTIKSFRDDILIKSLNMINPDVTEENKGIILISSEEGETECNDDKLLRELGVVDGCILKADDFFQNYELTITVLHRDVERDDAAPFEVIVDPSVLKPLAAGKNGANGDATDSAEDGASAAKKPKLDVISADDNDDDDLCIVDDDDAAAVDHPTPPMDTDTPGPSGAASSSSSGNGSADEPAAGSSSSSAIKSPPKKRKTAAGEAEPVAKRPKVDDSDSDDDDDVVLIDED